MARNENYASNLVRPKMNMAQWHAEGEIATTHPYVIENYQGRCRSGEKSALIPYGRLARMSQTTGLVYRIDSQDPQGQALNAGNSVLIIPVNMGGKTVAVDTANKQAPGADPGSAMSYIIQGDVVMYVNLVGDPPTPLNLATPLLYFQTAANDSETPPLPGQLVATAGNDPPPQGQGRFVTGYGYPKTIDQIMRSGLAPVRVEAQVALRQAT